MEEGRKLLLEDVKEPFVIIRPNRLYSPRYTDEQILDITRCYWVRNRQKASQCRLVLSAYRGIVVGVYYAERWVNGGEIHVDSKLNPPRVGVLTYGFEGQRAPAAVRNRYMGCCVRHLFKRGVQEAVRVFNLP